MGAIEIEGGSPRAPLREAIGRSIVLLVVVCPLLVLCWQLGARLPVGDLALWIYVGVALLLILCEHFLAFDRGWGSTVRGCPTDFIYAGVAFGLDKGVFVLCVTAVAALGRELSGLLRVELWPVTWSFPLQLLLALLLADVATYWRHRLFHRSALLWRFHQIHHSAEGLYWIRSAYTHPIEQLFILGAIMLPSSLLGAGDEIVAGTAFLFGLSGLLQHANVDSRSWLLNFVFATPEVHRLHHQANEIGDRSNFSAFFVWMDLLLGTYHRPRRGEAVQVGLEGVRDFPGDFLTHLLIPFRRNPAGSQPEASRSPQ